MKKVLILSTVHLWNDNRILYKEIASMKKLNFSLTYIVQHQNTKPFELNGINVLPIPIVFSKKKRLFTLQKIVYEIIKKENFDVIHFHDPELILLMFWVKKKFNINIIFDIHENVSAAILDKNWIPKIVRPIMVSIYKIIENIFIRKFDRLIIAEKSYSKIYGKKAIQVLNYPILLPEINNKEYGNINFVYTGAIMEIRGIWQMLNIFKQINEKFPNTSFTLVGRFAPLSLENDVNFFLINNNLNENVKIHGGVSISKVNEILKNSHIGFSILKPIGNYLESLPTKIFDYMNNKVVIIASNFPLYNEYIDIPQTGITVDYHDIDNSVNKISELVGNDELMKKMAQNGYSSIKENWNWENEEKKLLKVVNHL